MKQLLLALLVVVLLAALYGLPLLSFWAIKTLFGYSIALTFKTWVAAWVLLGLFAGSGAARSKS